MRYWVYDEEGILMRKFYSKNEALKYIQHNWTLVTKPKEVKQLLTIETHGEARW